MKGILFAIIMTSPFVLTAQVGSEIYLFDVEISKGSISVSNPVNATNHIGYDNQPSFHSSKPLLYYSSFNEDGRSDLRVYNYETQKASSFTSTNEREYSPTLTPDGKYISCIIQRDNDAQDLGKYPIAGGAAVTLIDNLIVGYHSWVDESNLILFVLGEPATLRWYDLKNKQDKVLAQNIGRSLHKIPGESAMSFVQKSSDENWVISRLDIRSKAITPITSTVKGSEDLTWTQNGKIIMSNGSELFFYDTKTNAGWKKIDLKLNDVQIKGVTRLAISKDGKKLAVVAGE